MKERPIPMKAHEVRAILSGAKTQTRRIVKDQDPLDDFQTLPPLGLRCPFGQPGDRLWVRETWRPVMEGWRSYVEFTAGGEPLEVSRDDVAHVSKIALRFSGALKERHSENWHPSIHMPRWASRITLEVTGVRVERLQQIGEADAIAEGVEAVDGHYSAADHCLAAKHMGLCIDDNRVPFGLLWDDTYGKKANWFSNPWVWIVEFRRL